MANLQKSIFIKNLFNYFQILAYSFSFDVAVPSQFMFTVSSIGSPAEQMAYNFDCFIYNWLEPLDFIYARIIFQQLTILVYIVILAFCTQIYLYLTKKITRFNWSLVVCSFNCIILSTLPSAVNQIMATVKSITLIIIIT